MKVVVLGAGQVGSSIASLLCESDAISSLTVVDQNGTALDILSSKLKNRKVRTHRIKINREYSLLSILEGNKLIVSALPSYHSRKITDIAIRLGIHFIDVGAKDASMDSQKRFHEAAAKNSLWIIPGLGFAPGLVNLAAAHVIKDFDHVDSLRIYCAGLPFNPEPPFNHWLAFTPQGMVDDYATDTRILENGHINAVPSLTGLESIKLDCLPEVGGLEAFYISGQAGSLVHSLAEKVDNLHIKTLRYPGHCELFRAISKLGFFEERIVDVQTNLTYRELLVRQLKKALPSEAEDCAVAHGVVSGTKGGKRSTWTFNLVKHHDAKMNTSAIMYCTAIPTVIVAELMAEGKLKLKGGVYYPETVIPLKDFFNKLVAKDILFETSEI